MKRYLKMIGSIVLYLAIYIGISIVVNSILGLTVKNTNTINWIRFNRSIITIITNIPTILVYMLVCKIMKQDFTEKCKLYGFNYKYIHLLALIGISLGAFSVSFLKIKAVYVAFPLLAQLLESIVSGRKLIIVILGTITIGTMLEEILFRGLVFDELKKNMNVVLAIILQGLIFGALTFNIPVMIYAGIGGMIFGIVYIIFNSMWAAIFTHIISSVTLLVLCRFTNDLITEANAIYIVIGSILVLAASIYLMIKSRHNILKEECKQASVEQVGF